MLDDKTLLLIARRKELMTYVLSTMVTVVERDPKAPFLITTTPRCKGEPHSFPWIVPLTFNSCLMLVNIKQGGIKYHF